ERKPASRLRRPDERSRAARVRRRDHDPSRQREHRRNAQSLDRTDPAGWRPASALSRTRRRMVRRAGRERRVLQRRQLEGIRARCGPVHAAQSCARIPERRPDDESHATDNRPRRVRQILDPVRRGVREARRARHGPHHRYQRRARHPLRDM
ncbi:MAG: hypothetical protein AVDCRST_MAG42-3188, partial [uncultured Chthoniobacterales bacterium]